MSKRPNWWGKVQITKQCSEVREIWFSRDDEPPELPKCGFTDDLLCTLDHVEDQDLLFKVIEKAPLKPAEIAVIAYRYIHEYTLQEVAETIGLTKERIRQIELKAIRKLQYQARNRGNVGRTVEYETTTWNQWRTIKKQHLKENQTLS